MSTGILTELLFDYAPSDRPLLSSDKMHNSSTLYKARSKRRMDCHFVCVCVKCGGWEQGEGGVQTSLGAKMNGLDW